MSFECRGRRNVLDYVDKYGSVGFRLGHHGNGLKWCEKSKKGAPNGPFKVGKIKVSYRPREGHIGYVGLVSKLVADASPGLEREAAISEWM